MPELPEVETTRRGVENSVTGQRLAGAVVRNGRLRWPVPSDLDALLKGQVVQRVWRRAKYLIFETQTGSLIVHLGMSGSLRVVSADFPVEKHDHVDLLIESGAALRALRFRDPRRFGAMLWQPAGAGTHPLLAHLGPEPLEDDFTGAYLHAELKKRSTAIKLLLMDNRIVVGVGNIYANEALFRAGIHPAMPGDKLRRAVCDRLVVIVKETLAEAIAAGGSTLRDFVDAAGKPGYFQQNYFVYDRSDQPCFKCGTPIRTTRQGQRSTFWCPHCQSR